MPTSNGRKQALRSKVSLGRNRPGIHRVKILYHRSTPPSTIFVASGSALQYPVCTSAVFHFRSQTKQKLAGWRVTPHSCRRSCKSSRVSLEAARRVAGVPVLGFLYPYLHTFTPSHLHIPLNIQRREWNLSLPLSVPVVPVVVLLPLKTSDPKGRPTQAP